MTRFLTSLLLVGPLFAFGCTGFSKIGEREGEAGAAGDDGEVVRGVAVSSIDDWLGLFGSFIAPLYDCQIYPLPEHSTSYASESVLILVKTVFLCDLRLAQGYATIRKNTNGIWQTAEASLVRDAKLLQNV